MSRIGFSRTQILILVSVWLTFLISFVMRLSWASLMKALNEYGKKHGFYGTP